LSKYLFGLKSTVSLKSQLTRFKFAQLINDELLPFYSDALSISGSLIKKLFETVSITWQPNSLWSATKLQAAKGPDNGFRHRAFRLDQYLTLGFTGVRKLYVEVMARHSYSNQSNNAAVQYFFLDSKLRYSNTKRSMDLSLSVTNLFNVKDYTRYAVYANQLVIDQYTIRGRMAVLRLDCYF
jgi:outer membrane receptor protein involved in Fe transport